MASARLAIAAVVPRLPPPSSTAVERNRSIACCSSPLTPARALAAIFAHGGGEPVFEVGIEAVLRLARLQIEEAEDQRAGKAEQRRRKRNAHAAERRGQSPSFRRIEQGAGVAADLQSVDHLADRTDGLDQAPEGAEQAEKHQQARHVARDVAGLVEPGGDRIQQMPHGLLRDRHPPRALAAEDRGHRRQQLRPPLDREPGIGDAEIVDPGRLPDRGRITWRNDRMMPINSTAPISALRPGLAKNADHDLLVEHHHRPARRAPGTPASAPGRSVARTVCSVRSPCRSGRRGLRALPVIRCEAPFSAANMAQRG